MKRLFLPSVPAVSRRQFVSAGISGLAAAATFGQTVARTQESVRPGGKLRVAAIDSIFRLRSHAYHIVGRMVFGFQKDGLHHQPNLEVVRMYNDQSPADDLSVSFC